jgi:integrase
VTWDEAVIEWLAEREHRKSIEEIKRVLRWLSAHLRGKALTEITDNVIRGVAKARREQPRNAREIELAREAGRPLPEPKLTSGATVNRHMAQLSAILHYAVKRGWLTSVPPISKAAEPAKRVAWLTKEQAAELLAELPPHLRAMAAFSLATGLRESNVRLLKWKQVDIERGLCWFEASEMKAGRTHTVPLNGPALQVLAFQKGQHKTWVFPVEGWRKDDTGEWALTTEPTGKISNHAWRKACERAGVPWLRFHDLRHTWASWHVQAGTPLAVLQELGGWKSFAMVQRYAHLGKSHVAMWAGNLAGTTPAQVAQAGSNENSPEGLSYEGETVGWLMGLEPTTTRITILAQAREAKKIKHLPRRKGPKAA